MPRIFAALLMLFTASAVLAQTEDDAGDAPITPDAPTDASAPATPKLVVNRFELENARDLRIICSVDEVSPDYDTARSFCIGFVTGAMNYYRAVAAGPNMGGFICTDRPVPRTDVINAFLEWSIAHPDMDSASAVENVMRAAAVKWPCGA